LQFNAGFGFADAARLAPYLAALGVSHVYASPYLMARPGSTHGYDIIDHTRLNPELGSPEDFEAMVAAFSAAGLGQILDFVPNHMGIGADNPFWQGVLEWGPASSRSSWFDIDWNPDAPHLKGKVLVPVLGDQYGRVLAAGDIGLVFQADRGVFEIAAYGEHRLPVDPNDYGRILASEHPELDRLGDAFAHIGAAHPHQLRRAADLKAELARLVAEDETAAAAVDAAVGSFRGQVGDVDSWGRLHDLIERQHWRLAFFRVAADDINYRRFFNINELAGLRIEQEDLFDHAHALIFELMERGVLDGLRIDHIDGLLDPRAYCERLRAKAPRPFYLVVEKILADHERIRADWAVDGTTGYEVANLLVGLLIDGGNTDRLTEVYREFTDENRSFQAIVRDSKLAIMDNEMASELNVLARDAARIAASNPMTADFTRNVLHRALKEVVAAFPVYRTYVDGGEIAPGDRRDLEWAFAHARRTGPEIDGSVFDFLHGLMTCEIVAAPGSGYSRHEVVRFAMRVQQYSGPVMAKGLEDTAFYRFNRMIAANEVGGHPDRLGVSVGAFHEANARRLRETPHAMLTTATHDTKRGEDARARLATISEIPDEWADQVRVWSRILRAPEAGSAHALPPDRNDEYLLYQMLLGAWPMDLDPADGAGMETFRDRIAGAMTKSMREAKVNSTWAAPNEDYEGGVLAFVGRALETGRQNPFLDAFVPFKDRMAHLGIRNSLVQTALKLTIPGVPDVYRGADLWDFSLVDPDNRRPVDFDHRARLLRDVAGIPLAELATRADGAQKLALIARLLDLRRRLPDLFAEGSYEPLPIPDDERVVAFVRRRGDRALVVVALRHRAGGGAAFDIALPDAPNGWIDALAGTPVANGSLDWTQLDGPLPVVVLVSG
ncbi:MAG TPA: malto-oligosyltrehalose synthase, partial [Methylomirabilota bacterium]|nr:malto-oligosyltrehalose synthase [Methylomirabilota bacterium]